MDDEELQGIVVVGLARLLAGFIFVCALTPLARRMAIKVRLVAAVRLDRLHSEPRPYGGGIAVLVALVLWFILESCLFDERCGIRDFRPSFALRLMTGALLFFGLGIADDYLRFTGGLKVLLQTTCAVVVVYALGLGGSEWLGKGGWVQVASVIWIVAVVNAFNLLDHADGVAASAGALAFLALAIGQMPFYQYNTWADLKGEGFVALPALFAAGCLAGFLVYNRPPAKLFMGDAGSMLVGFLLAALMMQARYYLLYFRWITPWVKFIPLAILAVPLFDMVCVTLSRIRQRQNPFRGDATSHLAHRMLARGWSPRGIVAFAAGASAVTGGASVAMYFLSGPALVLPWLAVAAVLVAMLLVRRPVRPEAAHCKCCGSCTFPPPPPKPSRDSCAGWSSCSGPRAFLSCRN